MIDSYVNLDVIAGAEGRREWRPSQIDDAAAQSYANQQKMKDAGLHPIPVFHQDERMHWLENYLDDGEPRSAVTSSNRRNDCMSDLRYRVLPRSRNARQVDTMCVVERAFPIVKMEKIARHGCRRQLMG